MMGGLQYNTQHRFEDMKDVVTDDSDGKGCVRVCGTYTTINRRGGTIQQ